MVHMNNLALKNTYLIIRMPSPCAVAAYNLWKEKENSLEIAFNSCFQIGSIYVINKLI